MHKHSWIFGLLLSLATGAVAQETGAYAKEFSFTTDNDAYLFRKNDAYYTNGFFFALRKAGTRNGKKTIRTWELAQKIYTPLIRKTTGPADIDRPYCGYLYLDYSQTFFSTSKDDVLRFHASLGVVGPGSLGEDVQNGYHSLLDYSRFTGWQYQVQNAVGMDVGISYARTLLQDSNWIKLVPMATANLGMLNTNATIGTMLCLGAFERNANSALWNARTQSSPTSTRRKYEFYGFWQPELLVQGYNATVQGGLFGKGSGAVLGVPETWVWQYRAGLAYAEDRWTVQLAFIHQSRETTTQKRAQQYASALLSYRFH